MRYQRAGRDPYPESNTSISSTSPHWISDTRIVSRYSIIYDPRPRQVNQATQDPTPQTLTVDPSLLSPERSETKGPPLAPGSHPKRHHTHTHTYIHIYPSRTLLSADAGDTLRTRGELVYRIPHQTPIKLRSHILDIDSTLNLFSLTVSHDIKPTNQTSLLSRKFHHSLSLSDTSTRPPLSLLGFPKPTFPLHTIHETSVTSLPAVPATPFVSTVDTLRPNPFGD